MKTIHLTKGKSTIVDDEDFDWLSKLKWQCTSDGRAAHHYKKNGRTIRVYMARMITKCPSNMVVDHKNRDKLDNRRFNLRVCTRVENNRNRRFSTVKTSKYIGVFKRKRNCKVTKPWCSYIWHGKHKHLGYFSTEEEAAISRDQAAMELFGEFAPLNFPRNVRPDLRNDPENLVPSCQFCNLSSNPIRHGTT